MIPSLRKQAVVQAGVGLLACFVFLPHNVDAAPIKKCRCIRSNDAGRSS